MRKKHNTKNHNTKKKKVNKNTMGKEKSSSKRVVTVSAMNAGQKDALRTISQKQVTVIQGVPGTGKTHLAVGWALQELVNGRFDKIILTRPVVEAGESLGFLPGDAEQKLAPYMFPMNEIILQYLSPDDLRKRIEDKTIIVLPIAYMRGVTFKNSCVIADECQNMTKKQIHLLLTRLGSGSKIIMTGDVEQSDLGLRRERYNGLKDAIKRLSHIPAVGMVDLGHEWCVREEIVTVIDEAYRDEEDDDYIEDDQNDVEDTKSTHDSLLEAGEFDDIMEESGDWEYCDCDEEDCDCDEESV